MIVQFTILLDLDDTLLENDVNKFLPSYIQSFSNFLKPIIDPNIFIRALLMGTKCMIENQFPDQTLQDVFDSYFFSATSINRAQFISAAEEFYEKVFPGLEHLTKPIPDAIQFINLAMERGHRLAISTNPLFPRSAIEQRLAWAGFPVSKFNFELIASYETFHFVKPNPAFFAEMLGRLGWPDGGVIVVGDDLERDILAAEQIGLKAYWISSAGNADQNNQFNITKGDLSDILSWIDSFSDENFCPKFDSIEASLAILRSTPAVLDTICRNQPKIKWNRRPSEGSWCLTEVICHFRDLESEVNLARINEILTKENPFLIGIDTDLWAVERDYIQQDGKKALSEFITARMELLESLSTLIPAEWNKPAQHSIFGRTNIKELAKIIAAHDRLHIQQIYRELLSYKQ